MNPADVPKRHEPHWQRLIEDLQEESRVAFLAQDVERLKGLWSEDLVVNSPINRVLDKTQVLDLLRKGVIKHVSYEEHIEVVKRHGDLVVVMGRDVVVDTPTSPPVERRFTNVWRETGTSWHLIARHASAVATR